MLIVLCTPSLSAHTAEPLRNFQPCDEQEGEGVTRKYMSIALIVDVIRSSSMTRQDEEKTVHHLPLDQ